MADKSTRVINHANKPAIKLDGLRVLSEAFATTLQEDVELPAGTLLIAQFRAAPGLARGNMELRWCLDHAILDHIPAVNNLETLFDYRDSITLSVGIAFAAFECIARYFKTTACYLGYLGDDREWCRFSLVPESSTGTAK